jgi:DNA mismatch repair protein MutS2
LLARARELAGTTRQANEELLAELQDKQAKLNRLLDRNKQQSEQLQAQRQRQEEARKQQEQERKRILQQAQAEADQLVQDANKQIEATIREIKEAQAEPQRTKAARQRLSEQVQSQKRQAAEASAAAETAAQEAGAANELAPGTRVRYQGASTEGEILAAEGDRYRISLGDITLSARPEDLEPVHEQRGGKNAGAPGRRSTSKTSAAQSPSESARAQQRIDLRGYRVPEAQRELTAFLDNAVMAGLERVEILHGKGQGVLRDSLRRFLRENFPYVQHLEDAPTREGGSGVTICYLG